MIITHNISAMYTNRQLGINGRLQSKTTERLSSGYKINRAADDAASLTISEKMRSQIRGLERGSKNVRDGISLCNVADGALEEVHSILGRMRELAVQAANDTYVTEDREAIECEIDQLKKEINYISRNTEFNTQKLFCNQAAVEFDDDVRIVKIYDANDGAPNDPDSYGGIIIDDDVRVPWKSIDSDMVASDPVTGKTIFKAGIYNYTVPSSAGVSQYDIKIVCEDGSKPPQIEVRFPVKANDNGLLVAGKQIMWSEIVNDDNVSLQSDVSDGCYHFNFCGGIGSFMLEGCENFTDVKDAINDYISKHGRVFKSVYSGNGYDYAIDITDKGSTMQVNNSNYTVALDNIKLRADENAIWLEDMNGNVIAGSTKSWSSMNINNWASGGDISDEKIYKYEFTTNGYNIKFDFELLDETSRESVIKGINNANVLNVYKSSNNSAQLQVATGADVTGGSIVNNNSALSISQEALLGRNFESETGIFNTDSLSYDNNTGNFSVSFSSGGSSLIYDSVSKTSKADYDREMNKVVDSLLNGTYSDSLMNVNVNMKSRMWNKSFTLSYQCKLSASMSAAANGNYVRDGAGYKLYNANDYMGQPMPTRYDINKISYEDMMKNIANSSTVNLCGTGYEKADFRADELFSAAVVSNFISDEDDEGGFWIQSGAGSNQGIAMQWDVFSVHKLGLTNVSVENANKAERMISSVDHAVEKISDIRITFGAYTNRLEHSLYYDDNAAENLQDAESRIRDTDMASEMSKLAKTRILMQAGQAMLCQANNNRQDILRLIQ